jgi:hypothetical protein
MSYMLWSSASFEASPYFVFYMIYHWDFTFNLQCKRWSDIAHHRALSGRARLLGGGGKLTRYLSHHDVKPVFYGTPDTCNTRVYAKIVNVCDYFSLWHDFPLFELSTLDGKPTGRSTSFAKSQKARTNVQRNQNL